MFFTALTAFRFPAHLRNLFDDLDTALRAEAIKPIGPQEIATYGFVSPFGDESEVLHQRIGDSILIVLGHEERILPPKAVDRALRTRIKEVEEREGRSLGARARKRLKEDVVFEMIPRAFTKHTRLSAMVDLRSGTLFVDTGSRKAAENVVAALRRAFGSFPALPLNMTTSPRSVITGWIAGETLPERFAIGDEAELRDPVDRGAVIKAQRQELQSEEIAKHLQSGKQCVRIGLAYDERATFVLDEALVVRKLKLTDVAMEQLSHDDISDRAAELDACFALFSGLVTRLAADLFTTFGVDTPEAFTETMRKAA